jgi:predicted nucleotidyltransferase
VYDELHGLVRKTFGIAQILKEALRSGSLRIRIAFVYGSIAEGSETAASDVDVMVVASKPSLEDIVSALAGGQRQLRREVNPTVYGAEEFCRKLAEGQRFLSSVVKVRRSF